MMFWVEYGDRGAENRGLVEERDLLATYIQCDRQSHPFRLSVTDDTGPRLFQVDRMRGVLVSAYQSAGICSYARIDRSTYFQLCATLGHIQWTVLDLNPLLVEEDLSHKTPSRCLFAPQEFKQDFALVLEDPHVCHGCMEFYHCLAAEPELQALRTLLAEIRAVQRSA